MHGPNGGSQHRYTDGKTAIHTAPFVFPRQILHAPWLIQPFRMELGLKDWGPIPYDLACNSSLRAEFLLG